MAPGDKKTLAVTSDGDLRKNDLQRLEWIDGKKAASQNLKIRLSTVEGEDPIDPEFGLDVFAITGGTADDLRFEITDTVGGEPRVRTIDEIEMGYDASVRQAAITVTVTLDDGEQTEVEVGL